LTEEVVTSTGQPNGETLGRIRFLKRERQFPYAAIPEGETATGRQFETRMGAMAYLCERWSKRVLAREAGR